MELDKQNKVIKERITYKGLIKKERKDTINVETIKRDIKLFF